MTDPDPPAPRARMTRADFILLTVGAELRRAGDYLHHQQVLRTFEARLPELEGEGLIDQVVLRWWRPDGTFLGAVAMKLTPPGTFAGPGFEGGDYVAEGRLPAEPGHTLQVAVHRYTDPEVAMAVDGEAPPDPWTWANREALDRAAGVELITGRYLPTADTVLRLVATERSRPELLKARQLELEHGRDDVVAAIDRRLAELPEAPPPPRHVGGRLGLLPLLLAAGLWADPRVPEHQRPPPVRRRGCGAPGCEDGYTPSGTCTTCNGLGADLPPGGSRR